MVRLLDEARLDVAPRAIRPLVAYLDRMLEENCKLNLTGIRDRGDALRLHVLDSLQVWAVTALAPRRVIDIGSGNGFPGIAAACLWPRARTILVERTNKKAAAIERCLSDTGLERVEVLSLDAAQIPARRPELRDGADLVLARAVGDLSRVIDLAAPLLASGRGMLVQWKGEIDAAERRRGLERARRHGLRVRDDYEYMLPGTGAGRRRLVCCLR